MLPYEELLRRRPPPAAEAASGPPKRCIFCAWIVVGGWFSNKESRERCSRLLKCVLQTISSPLHFKTCIDGQRTDPIRLHHLGYVSTFIMPLPCVILMTRTLVEINRSSIGSSIPSLCTSSLTSTSKPDSSQNMFSK